MILTAYPGLKPYRAPIEVMVVEMAIIKAYFFCPPCEVRSPNCPGDALPGTDIDLRTMAVEGPGLQGYAIALLAVVIRASSRATRPGRSRDPPRGCSCFAAVHRDCLVRRPEVKFRLRRSGSPCFGPLFLHDSLPLTLAQPAINLVLILVFIGVSLFIGYLTAARRHAQDHETGRSGRRFPGEP